MASTIANSEPQPSSLRGPVRRTFGFSALVSGLVMALLVAMTLGVSIGSVKIDPVDVWRVIGHKVGLGVESPGGATETIVWVIRLPRVLLAGFVGAGLASVGATLQAAVRNPIADPFVLGISSGASVGAVSVIAFGAGAALGVWALQAAAFGGAIAAATLVLLLATRRTMSPLRIVLTGTAVAYGASALTSFLIYQAAEPNTIRSVLFWLLGSLAGATWTKLAPAAAIVLVGLVVLWAHGRHLNALLTGDETAAAVGISPANLRRRLVVLTSLITASVVAVSGVIGFVGLLLPHAARSLVGNDHRWLLPVSAMMGATFLVLVDLVARTIMSPEEIPVGIITAGLGAPFFLWVLNRRSIGEYPS